MAGLGAGGWSGRQLALALEATTLGQRFVVLVVSVVYRGGAGPVAWKIVRATEKQPWQPAWRALLKPFQGVVPAGWMVIGLADRGWYAPWLFQAITALGWHPLLRVNQQGQFRPPGWHHWGPFTQLVPAVGRRWAGQGTAFRGQHTGLECRLLGHWGPGHRDPWLVLTDLPAAADACCYGLRAWIEHGFKHIKRGGWHWHYTRMDDPARAERLWLAIALATWWRLTVGGEAEAQLPPAPLPPMPGAARQQGKGWRLSGGFHRGGNLILAALLNPPSLPVGPGRPAPWPTLSIAEPSPSPPVPGGTV